MGSIPVRVTKTNLNRNTFGLGYFSFLSAFLRCFFCKHPFYFCYRLLCRERRLTRVWGVVGYFKPKGKQKPRRGCCLGSFMPYNHAPSRLLSIVPWNKCYFYFCQIYISIVKPFLSVSKKQKP